MIKLMFKQSQILYIIDNEGQYRHKVSSKVIDMGLNLVKRAEL